MATLNAFPFQSYIPNYANGLKISTNAVTPNTKLNVAAGTILDSTGVFQLSLPIGAVIDATVVGLNGIDTGALAASTVYAVYLVSDPQSLQASGCMVSLSSLAPVLPFGYSAFKLIGYATTDSSSHFLKGYWTAGNGATRLFTYDAPIACLTAGSQTGYTGVALTAFVPPVADTPVVIYSNFAANAAGNTLNYQGYNSTGDAVTVIAGVATGTANTTSQNTVLAQLNVLAPSIKYKVAAGAVTAYVCSYQFFI